MTAATAGWVALSRAEVNLPRRRTGRRSAAADSPPRPRIRVRTSVPPPPRYETPAARSSALRELLQVTLDWGEVTGRARRLEIAGGSYRLSPLAAGPGVLAFLAESDPGTELPDYERRRRVRAVIDRRAGNHLTIFTDAAHSALVWTWTPIGSGGVRVYRERVVRPGEAWAPLRPVLDSVAGPHGAEAPLDGATDEVLSALLAVLGWTSGGADPRKALQEGIESLDDPDALRHCWRTLLGFRVLDPACGRDGWLAGAAAALAAAYEACLERMRSWIGDVDRERPPARRSRLGDFRRRVARAGSGFSIAPASSGFAGELVVLHNVFGTAPDPSSVGEARARLGELLGLGGEADALLRLSIRRADPPGSDSERPIPARIADDLDLLARAASMLRRLHLDSPQETSALARGVAAAAARLDELSEAFGSDLTPDLWRRVGPFSLVRRVP